MNMKRGEEREGGEWREGEGGEGREGEGAEGREGEGADRYMFHNRKV